MSACGVARNGSLPPLIGAEIRQADESRAKPLNTLMVADSVGFAESMGVSQRLRYFVDLPRNTWVTTCWVGIEKLDVELSGMAACHASLL